MPWIVPYIPLIAAGVTAGTQIGLTVSGAGQPDMPQMPQSPTVSPDTQAQQQRQQQAMTAARQPLANIQAATGGMVAPDYMAKAAAAQIGAADQINPIAQLASQMWGINSQNPRGGLNANALTFLNSAGNITPPGAQPFMPSQLFNGGLNS